MNCIIQTLSGRRLEEKIMKSSSSKADNGNGIVNWQCMDTDGGYKALALTEGQ